MFVLLVDDCSNKKHQVVDDDNVPKEKASDAKRRKKEKGTVVNVEQNSSVVASSAPPLPTNITHPFGHQIFSTSQQFPSPQYQFNSGFNQQHTHSMQLPYGQQPFYSSLPPNAGAFGTPYQYLGTPQFYRNVDDQSPFAPTMHYQAQPTSSSSRHATMHFQYATGTPIPPVQVNSQVYHQHGSSLHNQAPLQQQQQHAFNPFGNF